MFVTKNFNKRILYINKLRQKLFYNIVKIKNNKLIIYKFISL